jgi:hypothetical protein
VLTYELDLLDLFILVDVGTERSESVRWWTLYNRGEKLVEDISVGEPRNFICLDVHVYGREMFTCATQMTFTLPFLNIVSNGSPCGELGSIHKLKGEAFECILVRYEDSHVRNPE